MVGYSGYIFASRNGEPYTKGGWKATLKRLMDACAAEAAKRGVPFEPFNLRHMRPAGVTDAIESGRSREDVRAGTLHVDTRMIDSTYDRAEVVLSNPVECA